MTRGSGWQLCRGGSYRYTLGGSSRGDGRGWCMLRSSFQNHDLCLYAQWSAEDGPVTAALVAMVEAIRRARAGLKYVLCPEARSCIFIPCAAHLS